MRVHLVMIPFDKIEEMEDEINGFLEDKKGVDVHWFTVHSEYGVKPGILVAITYKVEGAPPGFHPEPH